MATRNAGIGEKAELTGCLAGSFWKQVRRCLASSVPQGSSACHPWCMWQRERLDLRTTFLFAVVDVASMDQSVSKASWAQPAVLRFCLVYGVLSVPPQLGHITCILVLVLVGMFVITR